MDNKSSSQMEQSVHTGELPSQAVMFSWLMASALASVTWSMLYPWFNPDYANLASALLSGLIAGFFQWILLVVLIPNANRRRLAVWIPASMLGWATGAILYALVELPDGMAVWVAAANGLILGVLQWLILRKYSPIAFWWVPACIVDWTVTALLYNAQILGNISYSLSNFIFGVAGSIASSLAIVIILKKTLPDSTAGAEQSSALAGNKIETRQLFNIMIGFMGWFAVFGLYWGIIYSWASGAASAAMAILVCFVPPLPATIIAVIVMIVKPRWRGMGIGVISALMVNLICYILFKGVDGSTIGVLLACVPFFL